MVTVTLGSEMSWPSPQEFGGTANPLKPAAPQRLRVTERGHTHIDLAWTAPDARNDDLDGSEEGPSVITHYILEISDDAGVTWTQRIDYNDETGKEIKITGTSYTDTQLMPGQTRDYRIRAVNSSNMSIWSNTADGTTLEAVLPNEPGGLTAESAGPGSIKLCWNTQAEQPEDAPVFEYLIEYSDDGKTGWTELTRVTDYTHDKMTVMKKGEEVEIEVNKQTYTVYTDSTVMAEETRYYRVFAINLRGQSDQSDVASATTGEAPPNTAPMAGTAIADQTVMAGGTVMVQSTITDADMDDTLTWSAASDMEMYATATVDDMGMVTITGVAAGMATITVTAMDAAGESTMQTIMVTVEAAEFTAPTSVAATSASGTITINWMPGDLAASAGDNRGQCDRRHRLLLARRHQWHSCHARVPAADGGPDLRGAGDRAGRPGQLHARQCGDARRPITQSKDRRKVTGWGLTASVGSWQKAKSISKEILRQ